VASIVAAWVCGNCLRVVPVRRVGAGGIFSALRTRRMVGALTRWPGFGSLPWIGWYPRPLFWMASRLISGCAAQHGDLVPQHEQPGVLGGR
jgi:hypothetical protein